MGSPRHPGGSVALAIGALLVSACAGTSSPVAESEPSAPSVAVPSATPTEPAPEVSRSGARADVPTAAIMAQLARRAERIAKRTPLAPLPAEIDAGSNRALGYREMLEFGFPADQWPYLDALWQRESGWNHLAENPSSGAYGIPQSLPATKMAVVGGDWRTNPETQIRWGLAYIAARYGNAQKAWEHSERTGWY
ncbi:transglycosylase SLT domain-containing protein [Nocardioides sp. LHD-245]|uniref:aggregation-promoting factor C-terminal-like domain-containing protein n=1 Tax=Nocardioides sp. LHD-245 TaxID=3051387 RepID=UPI0027DFB567|nr:transglycosylase SLT domain-containing protein [Nocardioides sp. LHD-245]